MGDRKEQDGCIKDQDVWVLCLSRGYSLNAS